MDLDTLRALTGLSCDLDEDEGLLTLTMDEENLGNVNNWIEIPAPGLAYDNGEDDLFDDAEDAVDDDYDDYDDYDGDDTDFDVDPEYDEDDDYDEEATEGPHESGRGFYEYVAKYFEKHR